MNAQERKDLLVAAAKVRLGIIEGVYHAKSGHPGGSLSSADIFTYLYFKEMNINPQTPKDPNRDRFVLSKGHCAPGLYAVLAEKGFFAKEELATLRHIGSILQGHPNMNDTPGVDMSTGSLGQGISAAVGMALAARQWGQSYRTYALVGDGESEEGQVWEAAMFAAHRALGNLVAIVDSNNLQIDGHVCDVCSLGSVAAKFEAFGWCVVEVQDGNDVEQCHDALVRAAAWDEGPCAVVLHTVKGKGVSFMEDQAGWHGKAPSSDELACALAEIDAAQTAVSPKEAC